MVAKIIKVVDGRDIEYGTYDYNTKGDINYVNLLAESIRDVDGVETRLEFIYDPIEKQLRDWLDRQIAVTRDVKFDEGIFSYFFFRDEEIHIKGVKEIAKILRLPVFKETRNDEEFPYQIWFVYNSYKFFELSKED